MTKRRRNNYKITLTESAKPSVKDRIDISEVVLTFRKAKNLSAVELCHRAGDLDPKTLNALEKGRIKNPSIKTLQSVSRGLDVSVSDLFKTAELQLDRNLYLGTQKGVFQLDFPTQGIKIISFTPLNKDFFCGKVIVGGRKKFDQSLLKHPHLTYISSLVGRLEAKIEDKSLMLREGENLFFNGVFNHTFYNPLEREAAFLLVTAPSFL